MITVGMDYHVLPGKQHDFEEKFSAVLGAAGCGRSHRFQALSRRGRRLLVSDRQRMVRRASVRRIHPQPGVSRCDELGQGANPLRSPETQDLQALKFASRASRYNGLFRHNWPDGRESSMAHPARIARRLAMRLGGTRPFNRAPCGGRSRRRPAVARRMRFADRPSGVSRGRGGRGVGRADGAAGGRSNRCAAPVAKTGGFPGGPLRPLAGSLRRRPCGSGGSCNPGDSLVAPWAVVVIGQPGHRAAGFAEWCRYGRQ